MAQQINLHSPILLAPRRHFATVAVVRALAVLALGLIALVGWSAMKTQQLRRDLESVSAFHANEQQRLNAALAGQKVLPSGTVALEQELARERQAVVERQRTLDELTRGLVRDGRSPAALLRLLAATLPASIWLGEVKLTEGRLEVAGYTLQPEALRPWLARLAAEPMTAAQQLGVARVDRGTAAGAGEAWSFRLTPGHGLAPVAAASGAAR